MTQREKLLGLAVGGLVALFALAGLYTAVSGAFTSRHDEIARLQGERDVAKTRNLLAKRDQVLVDEFRKRSLPADRVGAQRQLVQWLREAVEEVGLQKEATLSQGVRSNADKYDEITCVITGQGDIKQLTELLYTISSADSLHRIRQLTLNKLKNDQLKMDVTVQALSMPEFDKVRLQNQTTKTLSEEELDQLARKHPVGQPAPEKMRLSLEEYMATIATRNLFEPANRAPEVKSIRRQEVELGERLTFTATADDPDDDKVEFRLGDGTPEGAKISEGGRFSWKPDKLGTYQVTVIAKDRGIPSAEHSRVVQLKVVEKQEEEEEPEFDESKLAVLTAILQGPKDPEPLMCMYLRADDDYQYLAKGDDIEIGDWSGTIESVEPTKNVARIRTKRGQYILPLGKTLADAEFVATKKQPE